MSQDSKAISAAVQLLGVALTLEDRERISNAAGPDLKVRWSVPSGSALPTGQDQGPHSAFLVRLLGLGVHSVVSPGSGDSGIWRSVRDLVAGVWQTLAKAEDGISSDAYVALDLATDLVAIKLSEEALSAQMESLSGQWDAILAELHEQTRGPITRIYVLSQQDGKWTLTTPTESERFLQVLKLATASE